jgi:hypothetical protein
MISELRAMSYELRASSYELRATSYEIRAKRYDIKMAPMPAIDGCSAPHFYALKTHGAIFLQK